MDESELKKRYLVGVFDGEGCIATGKTHLKGEGRYTWYLAITVCMSCEPIIRQFIEVWGGNYHQRKGRTKGGLVMHQWHIASSRGIPFLEYLVEHSLCKREQAKLALELARNMAKYSWAGYRKGISLNRGERLLTEADRAERDRIVMDIRALQGARSRFGPPVEMAP